MFDSLCQLNDPHMAFVLLRFCAGARKIVHTVRTTPPHLTRAQVNVFDQKQRGAFEATHRPLSQSAWQQTCFPLDKGGLGLTPLIWVHEAAYISSFLSCWSLIEGTVHSALSRLHLTPSYTIALARIAATLKLRYGLQNEFSFDSMTASAETKGRLPHFQHVYQAAITDSVNDSKAPIWNSTATQTRLKIARLKSCSQLEATLLFSSHSNPQYNPTTNPEIWKTMIELRLGERVFGGSPPCNACATSNFQTVKTIDDLGYHAMVCPVGTGSTRRHNAVQDTLYTLLKQPPACLCVHREWKFSCQSHLPEVEQQRLDLVIDDLRLSPHLLAVDVTIVSPKTQAYVTFASRRGAGAASRAEELEHRKYKESCSKDNVELVPCGFDIHGGAGLSAKALVRRLAEFFSTLRGSNPGLEYRSIMLRLERTVLQDTAAAVNRRRLAGTSNDLA